MRSSTSSFRSRALARATSSLLLLLCACAKREAPEPAPATASPPQPAATAAPMPREAPAPLAAHPPPSASGAAPSEPARAGGITWEAPAPFERRAPKSSMRAAEYGLAGAPQTELGVFYFGADQGGGVDANVTRWVGQFQTPDGKPPEPKRSARTVKGVEVALVEARGTYAGMAMPGGPAPVALSDAALLGAIAKGPDGSVFFKLVGPQAEVEKARPAFAALIDSIHKVQSTGASP